MTSPLQHPVQSILELLVQEPTLRSQDITGVQSSLRKVISPTFEIVFAGAFSAGKSMLINALLERKLLYSAEGHATGTECKVAYAERDQEHVVLTFMSQAEIAEQAGMLAQCLGLSFGGSLESVDAINALQQQCMGIIQTEGGKDKSEKAKQADALRLLLEGHQNNCDRIQPTSNAIYPMEQLNFGTLEEAAGYARRGSNSAVLKRIEYYCHHALLKDGNVLIDTPGIDAPVKRDAELTYNKIKDSDTSAVICVLKTAQEGDLTSEETKLLETIRNNPGIRDRVFYTFNRIDKTWYNHDLRERLERLLHDQFQDTTRIYKTSGLLVFYGSQIKLTSRGDRFGLDSIFAEQTRGSEGKERSPLFVEEFKHYCGSGKLVGCDFRIAIRSDEQPNENYVRILSECGTPLIDQLIKDSGIEAFRTAIKRYLKEEKQPQLFAALADDLQPLCIALRKTYIEAWRHYDSQPRDVDAMKEMELKQLNHDLKQIGDQLELHIEQELNQVVASNANQVFEDHFLKLQKRMRSRLDELLQAFSVKEVYKQAQASHKRNSVVPLLGILAEAFYYLANGLESVLEAAAQDIIENFFQYLLEHIRKQDFYRNLYRLLGNDSGLEDRLHQLEEKVSQAVRNEARIE
jgi:replication fork clamp-binding protein CrfC